jgi:hypothetical protein
MDQTAAHRRDPLASAGRGSVARCAVGLWVMAGDLRAVSPLATGRGLGSHPGPVASPCRCCGIDHLGCQRRLDHCPGPPAAAGARKKGTRRRNHRAGRENRSRPIMRWDGRGAGLTTKLHLATEQGHKPLSLVSTAGQRGDSPQFQGVSGAPSRRRPTRCATEPPKDRLVAGRPRSTRDLPAAPGRGMRNQSTQAQPRRRHQIRQARRPLRSHSPHRRDQRVAITSRHGLAWTACRWR